MREEDSRPEQRKPHQLPPWLVFLDAVENMTGEQVRAVSDAFARANRARFRDSRRAAWRATHSAGRAPGELWELTKRTGEQVAAARGFVPNAAHRVGCLSAALACRELLTAEDFAVLTDAWRRTIGEPGEPVATPARSVG